MSGSSNSSISLSANRLCIEEGGHYVLKPGDELPYRLRRSLGHGHSGSVEEIEDARTGVVYARKTIRVYGLRDRAERRRIFDNEINIIRNLASHHHIIRIFATYVAKREVGLILHPVADDGDFDAFLERFRDDTEENEYAGDGRLDQTKITILKRAFGCLVEGLEFMHQRRVRHKDIKPKNILIHRGRVLYTDFGYSLDSSQSSHSTTAGKPDFLTRRYSAPEVLQYESRNSRSDIFSLGCVFIEILSVLEKNLDIDEILCFGEDISEAHRTLEKANARTPTTFLADLSNICISMTQPEPLNRPNASQVLANIQKNAGYFCMKCEQKQALGVYEIVQMRQTGNSPRTIGIIGDQTALSSASTKVGSTTSNLITDAKVGRASAKSNSPPIQQYLNTDRESLTLAITPVQTLEGHSNYVNSVAFSHNSTWLASGSRDDTIRIWDTDSGECLQTLQGHSHTITSVAFSRDSTKLASGSCDNTAKIWSASTHSEVKAIRSDQHTSFP